MDPHEHKSNRTSLTVPDQLHELAASIRSILAPHREIEQRIAELLKTYAPEKAFRSTDYVGALGEVYAKLRFGGRLVDDSHEHDLEDKDSRRVSVKARRGNKRGWEQTSAIPTIDGGEDGPDDLVFVSLHDDYTPRKIWRYEWADLLKAGRFKEHIVRKERRSFVFFVSEEKDAGNVCYEAPSVRTPLEMDELPEPITIDLAKVRAFVHGPDTPAYRIMHEMNRVLAEEGLDGHRGAPRALLAFVEELAARCRA